MALLVLGLLLTPSPSAQTNRQSGGESGQQGDTQSGRTTDEQTGAKTDKQTGTKMGSKAASMTPTQFLKHAMMANMAEITLGEMAAERASSSQVKQFAQHMIASHTKANEQVKQVAKQKGVEAPTDLDTKHKQVEQRLSNLRGAEFDRAYMDYMVKDHREDVEAFTAQSKNSQDQDVRSLASKILPDLQQHLQMATETRQQVGGAGRAE